ncbi:MAG: hypothetical protein LBS29_05045 [Endomicrobium sp.]|nr:hypothetical protein [Endomicrobium sp.]
MDIDIFNMMYDEVVAKYGDKVKQLNRNNALFIPCEEKSLGLFEESDLLLFFTEEDKLFIYVEIITCPKFSKRFYELNAERFKRIIGEDFVSQVRDKDGTIDVIFYKEKDLEIFEMVFEMLEELAS